MTLRTLKTLNNKNLNEIVKLIVENDKDYSLHEGAINKLFNESNYKLNTDENVVLAKVALVDFTNSTNLVRCTTAKDVVDKITSISVFDNLLSQGDVSAVDKIAKVPRTKNDETNNKKDSVEIISFASKYCFYHDHFIYHKNTFIKYDTVVSKAIRKYIGLIKKEDSGFHYVNAYDSKYLNYLGTVTSILDCYGINETDCPERLYKFDLMLWWLNRGKAQSTFNSIHNPKVKKDINKLICPEFNNL